MKLDWLNLILILSSGGCSRPGTAPTVSAHLVLSEFEFCSCLVQIFCLNFPYYNFLIYFCFFLFHVIIFFPLGDFSIISL